MVNSRVNDKRADAPYPFCFLCHCYDPILSSFHHDFPPSSTHSDGPDRCSYAVPIRLSLFALPSGQDKAYVDDQRYKEGKFILEKNLLCDV